MNEEAAALARAIAEACEGQSHPAHLRRALSYGFVLVEDGNGVRHEPPTTAAGVTEILPRAKKFIENLEAEFGGLSTSEPEEAIEGFTLEETQELQELMGEPAPGTFRPTRGQVGFRELTEEEMDEVVRLSAS